MKPAHGVAVVAKPVLQIVRADFSVNELPSGVPDAFVPVVATEGGGGVASRINEPVEDPASSDFEGGCRQAAQQRRSIVGLARVIDVGGCTRAPPLEHLRPLQQEVQCLLSSEFHCGTESFTVIVYFSSVREFLNDVGKSTWLSV